MYYTITHITNLSRELNSEHNVMEIVEIDVVTARQHSSSYAKRCISYDRFCLTV